MYILPRTVGATILAAGLLAVILGAPRLFSPDDAQLALATFLIFGGMVAALTGASLVKFYYGSSLLAGRALFGLCFASGTVLMGVGLYETFFKIGISVYLLVVGFIAAVVSAVALK